MVADETVVVQMYNKHFACYDAGPRFGNER